MKSNLVFWREGCANYISGFMQLQQGKLIRQQLQIIPFLLLMPKIIAPKRTSKNVSAEEYWAIRQKFTKEKDIIEHSYKEKEVLKRNRFLKLRDQINNFNPLQYFLTKDQSTATGEKTHTHAYLQQIHYHLPEQIMDVKKLMFGLASILQNIEKINSKLFEHLGSDDAWKLLQTLLKDTRQQSYESWVKVGLQKIVANVGTQFKQSMFRSIFTTLCIFMESCFDRINRDEQSLMEFTIKMCQHYFTNRNKYIRRFGIECSSYVFSNADEQNYQKLISQIVNNKNEHELLYSNIGHILAERLKYSDGCLTPNSLQQLINMVNWLNHIKADSTIITHFIYRVLSNLQQKRAHEESQTLFDFGYVVKAFIQLGQQHKIKANSLIHGLVMYLQETIHQKHAKPRHINEQLMPIVSEYLWEHLGQLNHQQYVFHLLALSFSVPLKSLNNITGFLSATEDEQLILNFLELVGDQLKEDVSMLLIASFKNKIQQFLTNPVLHSTQFKTLIVYKLFILSKQHNIVLNAQKMFDKPIQLSKSITQLVEQYHNLDNQQIQLYQSALTFLRMLTLIQLPIGVSPNLKKLLEESLKKYYVVLREYFNNQNKQNNHIFSCNRYVQEIFLYSHSSIPFVWRGFNIIQAFIQIQKKINTNLIDRQSDNYSLWHKIIVNRISIGNQIAQVLSKNSHNYLFTLRSRHRVVRLIAIESLTNLNMFANHQKLVQMMKHIDSDDVDLQTQRDVKRMLLDMLRYVQQSQLPININDAILCWCLGFAFTGFKLIQQSFANFLAGFIESQQNINLNIFMAFVEYYTFRNSRVYDQQISNFFNRSQIMQNLQLPQQFKNLINKDFQNFQTQTLQFIGIDRVALAISKSEKVKKKLGNRLLNLLNQYFQQQFVRHKKQLINSNGPYMNQDGETNKLLLPPKTTFLKQILKMVPGDFVPPLECLHYTHQYLKLNSILKMKNQEWQMLWHKSTKMDHTQIQFGSLSEPQKQLYIHFLWGEMLRSDANRLRIIIEHIRDNMNSKVEYLMSIFIQQLTLGIEDQEQLKRAFASMDSRKLLTFIYILKCISKTLRNYLVNNFDTILTIIINIIQILQPPISQITMESQLPQAQEQKEQENESEQDKTEETEKDNFRKYKNHRKQIFKILNSLISLLSQEISVDYIDRILSVFSKQKKIANLWKMGVHSTPGLLLFLNQLGKHPKFHTLLIRYDAITQVEQILRHGHEMQTNSSLMVCIEMLKNMLHIVDEDDMLNENDTNTDILMTPQIAEQVLSSMLALVTTAGKISINVQQRVYKIILQLMKLSAKAELDWEKYLLSQMTKIVSMKSISEPNKAKLSLLLLISMQYSYKSQTSQFLTSMLVLIPQLKDIEHRKIIVSSIAKDIQTGKKTSIGNQTAQIVYKLNCTIDGGLIQQIDYPAFFEAINTYKDKLSTFSAEEHQFIIYNILAYLASPQLSVRKAVSSSLQIFLQQMNSHSRQLVSKLFRIVSEQLKKPYNSEDHIFWAIFSLIGHFTRWVIQNDLQTATNYSIITPFVNTRQRTDNDMFQQLCAIAQNKKLQGLKTIKNILKDQSINLQNKIGDKYPNILTGILLPALEHFILPPILSASNKFEMTANLTSSLAHVSLQIYEFAMKRGGEALQKKQLKRIISKIKFEDSYLKRNITIIKIIGQIVESIELPRVTQNISKTIKQHGFDDFHKKFVEKQSKKSKIRQNQDGDSDQQDEIKKKLAFNGYNNQIDDDQLINMGYLTLDKKLMKAEEEQNMANQESSIIRFLKMHVLMPLKTMLMFQNKSQKNSKQETDKSRMFLSIVVTKIIMKFPSDVFLNELQKILSKLGRLLKKREVQVRQNARKCLAQIAKLVGPDLFYIIFRQLKFHLRDNFQNHVLNYSIFFILQKYGRLQSGSLDHCLPIILPSIIDELFGKSAAQKDLIDQNLIPTINMQSKKKKGNDLLTIICKQISISKIDYLVKYFQKFLLQYMNTQANVSKYEQMLTNMIGGLSKNQEVMSTQNSRQFVQILHQSIQKLKAKIKLYKFDEVGFKHQSTVKQQQTLVKKAGREVLQIQQQAGRNASIFRKQAKQIKERRNHQILIGCFMQFYLALLALLIKKKIIDSQAPNEKFESIITFIVECIEHRDNRLVHKCLKVIHNVIHWKKLQNIAQIRKKASRKIFALIEKLTSADQDLLRECFTLLNDLFEQVNITGEVLQVLITIIKLHITTVDRTIAEQPYKLLKTVLIKISNETTLMHDPAVAQMYEYVKATMISTTLDQIRNVCKDICCIFMKQQPSITHLPGSKKKHHKHQSGIDYSKQLSFYLNNLECKYSETQSAILDVVRTYALWHSKEELEQTGQIVIMALGTAYSNDQDNQSKITELIKAVCQKIDNSKVISLIDKCLTWTANQDNQLIANCGFFLLKAILQSKENLLNENRKNIVTQRCLKILQKQYDNLLIYQTDLKQKIHQTKTLKDNPEWENIIQAQDVYLKIQKNFKNSIITLNILLEQYNKIDSQLIILLWKLIEAPSQIIHARIATILVKINSITQSIGEKIVSVDKEQQDSFKNKFAAIVKKSNQFQNLEYVPKIFAKVFNQIKEDDKIIEICESLAFTFLNRISKSILNLKKNEKSMNLSYQLLQLLFSEDKQICQKLLKNGKLVGQIFWNVAKVNRNQLIELNIKQKNQQFCQLLKNNVGQAEFYRRLANVQADRKLKKATQKSELMKLAVTDQEAFEQAKAKKKHKKG